MPILLKTSAIALGIAGLVSGTAIAGPCGHQAAEMAETLGMSTDLPQGSASPLPSRPSGLAESGEASPLTKSGGVIAPPDLGNTPTLTPPDVDGGMPTAPPATTRQPGPQPKTGGLSPDLREKIESLLTAARQEDEAGRDRQCQQRLADAKKLAASPG